MYLLNLKYKSESKLYSYYKILKCINIKFYITIYIIINILFMFFKTHKERGRVQNDKQFSRVISIWSEPPAMVAIAGAHCGYEIECIVVTGQQCCCTALR
jgi:hypothetical protein